MTLSPAFTDPVADAQTCFRALLDAMARPGSVHAVGAGVAPPAPLAPATAAALLTLIDGGAPLWLDDAMAEAWEWLAFHCGAVQAGRGAAAFACATRMPDLAGLNQGSDAGPEESATLILQVGGFGSGRAYQLAGPGLRAPTSVQIAGLPTDFAEQWAANHALFPRGIDLVLCAGSELCAFPRSVAIQEA